MKRHLKQRLFLAITTLFCVGVFVSCTHDTLQKEFISEQKTTQVAIYIDNNSKSIVNSDGVSVKWQASDELMLWADDDHQARVIDPSKFKMYGFSGGKACFTYTLAEPMTEGKYVYNACYPYPKTFDKSSLTVEVPAVQDGRAADGADIMMAFNCSGGPLKKYSASGIEGSVCIRMQHMTHFLEFYLPEGSTGLQGEPIKKMVITASKNIIGEIVRPLQGTAESVTSNPSEATVTLKLADPLYPSSATARNYAVASILPTEFSSDDKLEIKLYSDSWMASAKSIIMDGRNLLAGHATPVQLTAGEPSPYYKLSFALIGNNLGENIQKITFKAPSGCIWESSGSETLTYDPSGDIAVGTVVESTFEDEASFRAFSKKQITVTYDSKHVTCQQVITLPDLTSAGSASSDISVPYLLFEDFSTVSSFSSDDQEATSSTGSKAAYSFLNGWTAARAGAQAGNCIRIAGRRESGMWIDAHYPARADSAPLPTIKSAVKVDLSFTFGTNCGGMETVGQTIYVGYVTSTTAYESGDETGSYPVTFEASALEADWTTNHKANYQLDLPAGTQDRISWRNDPASQSSFAGNSVTWLYIDNVVVKVASGQ